jgi:anti-sigma regulatory factor (Ser/Thr protein kinase)
MTPPAERDFEARMAALSEALAFVEDFCRRHDIGRDDLLRLTLVVEELFTNTVEHGQGDAGGARIRLELSVDVAGLALLYEDESAPFDAQAQLTRRPPSLDAALDARPVGGLGLHLVAQLAASTRYAREEGRNRLWILLRPAA